MRFTTSLPPHQIFSAIEGAFLDAGAERVMLTDQESDATHSRMSLLVLYPDKKAGPLRERTIIDLEFEMHSNSLIIEASAENYTPYTSAKFLIMIATILAIATQLSPVLGIACFSITSVALVWGFTRLRRAYEKQLFARIRDALNGHDA